MRSKDEKRCIRLGGNKTKLKKPSTESSIPGTGRLFETIDSSLQFAHMRRKPSVFKTRRLLHINILREKTMKKCIADINLPQSPSSRNGKGKSQTNSSRLHHWTERITIINT